MELCVPPDIIDRVSDAIAELAGRYDPCIISDTIYTPRRGLRDLLPHHEIAQYFRGFAFSDQAGRSKPDPDCFRSAAMQLGVDFSEVLHIGDQDAKDIAGAQDGAYADLVSVIDNIALR